MNKILAILIVTAIYLAIFWVLPLACSRGCRFGERLKLVGVCHGAVVVCIVFAVLLRWACLQLV